MAYLVRSLRTCARIRSLTTGTFNLIVKDRISDPPERREFSPPVDTQRHLRPSSKPYKHTVQRKPRQLADRTEFPRDFHIGTGELISASGSRFWAFGALVWTAQQYGPPLRRPFSDHFQAARGRKTENWIKNLLLEVLALKVPFRGSNVSESHPVAGTN